MCMVGQTRYERELRHFREFPSEQLACLLGLLLVRLQKFRGADAATLGFSSIKPSVSSTGLSTRINTDVFRRFWNQYWLSSLGPSLRPSSICNRLRPVLRAHADGRLLYCSSRHTGITSTFPAAGQTLPHPPAPHTKASIS